MAVLKRTIWRVIRFLYWNPGLWPFGPVALILRVMGDDESEKAILQLLIKIDEKLACLAEQDEYAK